MMDEDREEMSSRTPSGGDPPRDDLADRLSRLPKEAAVPSDLWPAIESRIGWRPDRRRTLIQVAAAALIFVLGAAGGFAAGNRGAADADQTIDEALRLATEVQRTGSEYVAALAAFASMVDSLSLDARVQGRDAAVATLFGAATQLASLGGSVPPETGADPGGRGTVRF